MTVVFLWGKASGATILVTSTAATGAGSLGQAIVMANTNPGPNTIAFQISGTPPFIIIPSAALPAITASVLIDGTTQSGYNGSPVILIDGTNTSGSTAGLRFSAGASTLRGLAIGGFPIQNVELDSPSNTVQGCFIGTDVTGTMTNANPNNSGDGILIKSSANLIGGTNSGNGNVISGGNEIGIYVLSGQNNVIQGNLIGVPAAGTNPLGNRTQGIVIYGGGENLVGGTVPKARNVISGNGSSGIGGSSGILIWNSSVSNIVQGNFIGTDVSGSVAVGNQAGDGVTIEAATGNLICSNLLSGNDYCGISITGPGASGNVVSGNFIGTDVTGKNKLGNLYYGVELDDVAGCEIGGTNAGSGNLISGNSYDGVYAYGGSANDLIQGNVIGLNATGTSALGNGDSAVYISGCTGILLGGTTAGARNLFSGNGAYGVYLLGPGESGITVEGNYIGTDPTGTIALGNFVAGIYLQTAVSNQIGGTAMGAGNLISGNSTGSGEGILLAAASWNVIQGNLIGTKIDGTNALPNFAHGIDLQTGSNSNLIGGTITGAANRIAWAQANYSGVKVRAGSQNNLISGNAIFGNGINGGLGISLGAFVADYQPTANVDCESDVPAGSANNEQNYPVITNVVTSAAGTLVRGYLDSAPGKTYHLEFFANSTSPTYYWGYGYGQGQVYLGASTLVLGSACTSNFATVLPAAIPASWVVSATATDPVNNTSEFSADVAAASAPALNIAPSKGGGNLVSFSAAAGPFNLQQTYSLVPPVKWVTVTSPVELTNGTYYVNNNSSQTNVFYRLSAP